MVRSRRGVTLLEIAIVIAIVGIMAALAGTLLTQTLPSWRTRRAAREFAADVMKARQLAIAQDLEYRVRMAQYDPDLDNGPNLGAYFVEKGDRTTNSVDWDIIPWDMDGSGTESGEGTVNIGDGGEDELRGVSIANWGTIAGVDGNDLVFSPQGWLLNPVSDFNSRGYIEITFVNKPARARGDTDEWVVRVSRGGMVRMESNRTSPAGSANGTPDATEWSTSGATGFTGG